jgi:hypothetical protein
VAPQHRSSATIYWLILPLTLLWPAAHLVAFALRFGNLPIEMVRESLAFVPVGFISAVMLVFCAGMASRGKWRAITIAGYAVAFPFGLVFSLLGGLVVVPILGATLFGLVPMLLGILGGFFLGRGLGSAEP